MFCSGCGQLLAPGQPVCPRCGRPVAMVPPPAMPGFQFELATYANKIRALSTVWFIYAGLNLVVTFAGLAFARFAFHNHFGPWGRFPWMVGPRPEWFGPAFLQFIWVIAILWAVFLFSVGWGLMHREPWGRIVAIVAAFLNLFKFVPFGTALGIWTLVTLMGYRNQTLYEELP